LANIRASHGRNGFLYFLYIKQIKSASSAAGKQISRNTLASRTLQALPGEAFV
jgi:hypothetical protein